MSPDPFSDTEYFIKRDFLKRHDIGYTEVRPCRLTTFVEPHTYDQIENMESQTEGILHSWHYIKNSKIGINLMPNEMLAEIFEHVCRRDRLGRLTPEFEEQWREISLFSELTSTVAHILSTVCRRWRAVIVQDSSLWTTIYMSDAIMLSTLRLQLERSRGALINIYVPWGTNGFRQRGGSGIYRLLHPVSHRIRKLYLDSPTAQELQLVTPNLQELFIDWSNSVELESVSPIFGGSLPRLTELTMWHRSVLPRMSFANLVSFALTGEPQKMTSLHHLLDFLDGSPLLKSIDIADYGTVDDRGTATNRISRLPLLKSLVLARSDSFIILSHIQIPSANYICISHTLESMKIYPGDCSRLGPFQGITSIDLRVAAGRDFF